MATIGRWMAAALFVLPVSAWAQARNGNVYDGTSHQPTAGVRTDEKAAGVAPTEQREQAENRDLKAINAQALDKAKQAGDAVPSAKTNVFGVQPGGVVQVTPSASGVPDALSH